MEFEQLCGSALCYVCHRHHGLMVTIKLNLVGLLAVVQMMETMSCEKLREMLCHLFPYPCKSRYTAITMMPRPPGLLGSLAFKWMTASNTTKLVVAAAGLAVLAASVAAVVTSRRRARG